MKNLLILMNSKHRSLIFFIISGLLICLDYLFLKHFLNKLDFLANKTLLNLYDFIDVSQSGIFVYIFVMLTACSSFVIFVDLKPYKEEGLINNMIYGLTGGLILTLIFGYLEYLMIGLRGGSIISLSTYLASPLILGIKNEFWKKVKHEGC